MATGKSRFQGVISESESGRRSFTTLRWSSVQLVPSGLAQSRLSDPAPALWRL